MQKRFSAMAFALMGFNLLATAQTEPVSINKPRAVVVATYTLPRLSLSQFGNPAYTEAALEQAKRNGLKFTDLPSIGSGLARAGENEFWGITDRGPNGYAGAEEKSVRTFPLPQFAPTIVRFTLTNGEIHLTQFIPLSDSHSKFITGLSNVKGEERLYESPDAKTPIPFDENGVDPEGIRVLPDGNFLLSEEYSPSVFVVSPKGEVLVRYTPKSKPLEKATYPVKAILPDIFTQRRINKGFENLALSRDGHFAYAILQSPMGDENDPRYTDSRIIRALKLDVSEPLNAKVVGEYLVRASPAREYSAKQKQSGVSWSDADCIAPDKLVVIERGKTKVKLRLVDLSRATNILERKAEDELVFEEAGADLAALGVQPAQAQEIFSTGEVKGIDSVKIEGVVVSSPTEIVLTNDNDFGIGDNTTGEPSMAWVVHLSEPLPFGNSN